MTVSSRALAAALLLTAVPAIADEADSTIVVTARAESPETLTLARTAGGIDLVAADDYADRLAVSLRDALAFSPGVYLQPRFGQEVRISIRGSGLSRGFHMRGLTLLQDGVPTNLADDNGDFQELDPRAFERIEVYRGANALRFGGSTLGGAVNAVTPTGRSAPGIRAVLTAGAFDTRQASASAGFATARGDAWVWAGADSSDGDRDHAKRQSQRFNGNVGVKLSERIETRVLVSANRIRQELPGTLTRAQALTTPTVASPAALSGDQARDIDSLRVQNRTTLALAGGTLSGGVFVNAKQLYHPIFQVVDQTSTDRGAFARLELDRVGGLPLGLAAGATLRANDVAAKQWVNVAGKRGALTSDAAQAARTLNAYAELRAAPVPALDVILSGVFSDAKRQVTNRTVPARSGRYDESAFAPRVGVLWRAMEGIDVFANYSRSVEFPGFGELNQVPFAIGGVVAPGFVPLDAQRAWTAEIGSRGSRGALSWDVSLYRATLDGELLQFDQGAGVPAATFNAGRTLHQGIEAAAALAMTPWATLRQSYTLNDFRFRDDPRYRDNRLPVAPRHVFRAELALGTDRLRATPTLEWLPDGAWADYANTTRAPGYALVGLRVEAAPAEGVSLFLDARNLTNRRAIGDISAVTRATAASAIYYPVERRALYAGARLAL